MNVNLILQDAMKGDAALDHDHQPHHIQASMTISNAGNTRVERKENAMIDAKDTIGIGTITVHQNTTINRKVNNEKCGKEVLIAL